MFTLIIEDLELKDLLDFNFDEFRKKGHDEGYYIGIHLNKEHYKGHYTLGISREVDFGFHVIDGRIYLTGGIDIPYHNTPIYYLEDDMEELLLD